MEVELANVWGWGEQQHALLLVAAIHGNRSDRRMKGMGSMLFMGRDDGELLAFDQLKVRGGGKRLKTQKRCQKGLKTVMVLHAQLLPLAHSALSHQS